jgi:spore coat polysaccharide biosynthesis protein SpsF
MIAAIIQARMGSTRLPGKVLKEISGRPMLWHVVHRIRQTQLVDEVIVATSTGDGDDEIAAFCEQAGVRYFRGSESDVLDRYYQTAKNVAATTIVRVTADCPFIDPTIIDKVITAHLGNGYDYISNTIYRSYPDGLDVEVFSFDALAKAWQEARLASEREHVTPYIWKNEGLFLLGGVRQEDDQSALRWTVDEPADFEFARQVYQHLFSNERLFLMKDIVALLESNPELEKINQGFISNEGYLRSLEKDELVEFAGESSDE